jgi:UDP-N-acetyl-D-glucosamine dehydrogenase
MTISTADVGIIGLGYVGLPLTIEFCKAGYKVIGFDIDDKKVHMLSEGQSYISYIPSDQINSLITSNSFEPTGDFKRLTDVGNIIITVPTPLNDHREPDLTFVIQTTKVISKYLRPGQLVVLESTTYPGTTTEVLLPILKQTDLVAGRDFFLAYSPERVDPNNAKYRPKDIPKVVGGVTTACLERVSSLYGKVFNKIVPVSSPEVAEASKLLENIFRSVNIALVNELKMLFDRMGIDIWEVIDASATKPFGFMPFYPGPGLGGHCIPIDPFYLTWKAREYDLNTRFIELAGEINTSMPYYVVQKLVDVLNNRGKSIKDAKVLILGAAYKKDIDDIRESPAVKIITLLQGRGAVVKYHDPFIPVIEGMRKYPGFKMRSIELTEKLLRDSDCVAIITDHSCYDYAWILKHSNLIIDTRNVYKGNTCSKVVKA